MKLITLNIELDKHFARFIPIVKKEDPDVFCVQEIYKDDIEYIKNELGYKYSVFGSSYVLPRSKDPHAFDPHRITGAVAPEFNKVVIETGKTPAGKIIAEGQECIITEMGAATFSKYPMESVVSFYHPVKHLFMHDEIKRAQTISRCLLESKITIEDKTYNVLNTHFTWSYMGELSEDQKLDYAAMQTLLNKYPSLILCGDFNSPRNSNGIYDILANRYTDNVPNEITSTIDGDLHRKGNLGYVVDSIFTTPDLSVTDLKVFSGVSDHCGISAIIK